MPIKRRNKGGRPPHPHFTVTLQPMVRELIRADARRRGLSEQRWWEKAVERFLFGEAARDFVETVEAYEVKK